MENVLIIEEVLRILNEEKIKVKEKLYGIEDNYYNVSKGNRKLKLHLGKRMDEVKIELRTTERLISKVQEIK
jgi:hypothetical protein